MEEGVWLGGCWGVGWFPIFARRVGVRRQAAARDWQPYLLARDWRRWNWKGRFNVRSFYPVPGLFPDE